MEDAILGACPSGPDPFDPAETAIDPVVASANALLGVKYLYPYQRLVVANILEAACGVGIPLSWPGAVAASAAEADGAEEQPPPGPEREAATEMGDGAECGRQIVILPTGAGKSLCFQLPALLMKRPTLVIYPILSLQSDQNRRLAEKGFDPIVLRGGQEAEERRRLWNRLEAGEGRFIIANPEVLLTEAVMRRLPSLGIAHLVLDEAHCVSEWGESFRPSYLRIGEIAEAAKAPLLTAFTATASPPVLEKIRRYVFGERGARTVIGNPDRPNIDYSAVGAILRDHALRDLLKKSELPAVVFCGSRARTERLARFLRAELPGSDARFYHAGLEREEKDEVERWFFQSDTGVLTATCAYGLGVDKANIRTVIHRDCPPTVEAYLQESGRAGRDGKPSRAILLWGPEDLAARRRVAEGPERDRFDRMLAYARATGSCRRDALLGMLGAEAESCGGEAGDASCDVCRGEASDSLREKASLIRFVRRNRRCYTMIEAASIAARGLGEGWTDDDILRALRYLEATGEIRVKRGPLWKGRITSGRRRKGQSWSSSSSSMPSSSSPSSPLGGFGALGAFGGLGALGLRAKSLEGFFLRSRAT